MAVRKENRQSQKTAGEKAAGEWSGDGNVELLNSFGGFALDARQAAEKKQGDGHDANLVMLGHDAVGEFVEEDGGKEKEAGYHAHGIVLGVRPTRMILFELRGDDPGDGGKNENPGGVKIDRDSQDFADA